ncbi:MAG: hypothetical protein DMF87_16830 [Acidobacteria bacterium]|nr:MAG: hypothetical protein DMF87_16830 [Acidobacteriota bacterium]
MKYVIVLALASAALSWSVSPAAAQVISTVAGTRPVAFHLMGGFGETRFQFVQDIKDEEAGVGGTVTGGDRGYIGAADLAFRTGANASLGFGGWMTKLRDLVITEPSRPGFLALTDTQTFSLASVYGNLFYKHVGVQAGVVPIRSEETLVVSGGRTVSAPQRQTDMDAFGVARFRSATFGAGLYRYGSRAASAEFNVPASPSAIAATAFANGSIGVGAGLSIDASFWYTAKDKNYNTATPGNGSRTRFLVGLGYGR